jgi:Dyp-type peroxidase family
VNYSDSANKWRLKVQENHLREQKRKQAGVVFPSATRQEHLLIIRFNITHPVSHVEGREFVRNGVMRLCGFFERIDNGKIKMDDLTEDGDLRMVSLSEFNFSATLGFGLGFFEKLRLPSRTRPKGLKEMPNHIALGDSRPYTLFQTDFIIQLGSDIEDVNRWVFQHTTARTDSIESAKGLRRSLYLNPRADQVTNEDVDIYSTISNWADVTDIHSGFQRMDGRNLMGFNDGISNPKRLSNDTVWTTLEDENQKYTDGTYMVFQKVEHDLDVWRTMSVEKQEEWVGRSKGTGLLLGTLSKAQDRKLASDLHSEDPVVRETARKLWKRLYDEQKDPDRKFFDPNQGRYKNIQLQCPVWSHVRKSNPRQADGAARSLIFRRGYLFATDGLDGRNASGLLFICFQRNIEKGFEFIKKNFLVNKNFPVPTQRKNFNTQELLRRRQFGRFTVDEIRKGYPGQYPHNYDLLVKESHDPDAQNTGKEGLSGPSEIGIYPAGQSQITITLGGGYYFIPPIPDRKISNIGEQFFI